MCFILIAERALFSFMSVLYFNCRACFILIAELEEYLQHVEKIWLDGANNTSVLPNVLE